jgi:hypothetical protein
MPLGQGKSVIQACSPGIFLAFIRGDQRVTMEALCRADPDVQVSRIRLSDKEARVRSREAGDPPLKLDQPQLVVQVWVREA